MIVEYIEAAMRNARFERIDDEEPYYGEIPPCQGVWATGVSPDECRARLREVLEGWLVLSLQKGLPVPGI